LACLREPFTQARHSLLLPCLNPFRFPTVKQNQCSRFSAVVPGGQPSAAALETLSTDLQSSPFTWVVNIAAGELP